MDYRHYVWSKADKVEMTEYAFGRWFVYKDELPESIDEVYAFLHPDNMRIVDGCTNESMIYEKIGQDSALLYAYGPDRDDDGGMIVYDDAGGGQPGDGDLVLIIEIERPAGQRPKMRLEWAESTEEVLRKRQSGASEAQP